MDKPYRQTHLILLLLQMQAAFCVLRCDLEDWNLEVLRCVAYYKEVNSILPSSVDMSFGHTTPIDAFLKYNWSLIRTFVLKDARIYGIHLDLFVNATSLQYLDLSGNPNLKIDSSFIYLNNLQTLKISGSSFYWVKSIENILQIPNLRTLIATKMYQDDLLRPKNTNELLKNLKKCPNLRILDVSQNNITDFAKFEVGPNLLSLNLSYCQLKLGDRYFGDAAELRHLFLSHSGISAVPEKAFEGMRLTHLDMSFNSITEEILTKLSLTITHLNLSHNILSSIDLNNLPDSSEVIDLSYNNISQITPLNSDRTTILHTMYLKNNRLKHVERTFENCFEIVELDLSFNLIESIDYAMSKLAKLQWLNLSGNKITFVGSSTFRDNVDLRVLLLGNNRLKYLGLGLLKGLRQLDVLDLRNNKLKALPYDLLQKINLDMLKISCNKLFFLPKQLLSKFAWIRSVILHGNPWKCGCLFTLMDKKMFKMIADEKYFATGDYPSCLVGKYNDYHNCYNDSFALSKDDFSKWNHLMQNLGIC